MTVMWTVVLSCHRCDRLVKETDNKIQICKVAVNTVKNNG